MINGKINGFLLFFALIILIFFSGCITDNNKNPDVQDITTTTVIATTPPTTTTIATAHTTITTSTTLATTTTTAEPQTTENDNNVKVEVYHFHGTHQCYSCIKVGELAEKTINTYFKNELDSGKIVFGHINGELPENQELVKKYGATGSSLWIGTYINGKFHKEQNIRVWYKINNEQEYMSYLKEVLEKRLSGNLKQI